MSLSPDEVRKIAGLAKLKLTDSEVDVFAGQLSRILDYVECLNRADVTDIEPMPHAVDVSNVFREDVVKPSLPRDVALGNAPATDGRFFQVPAILDSGDGH